MAEADAKLRQSLQDLAATFPTLKKILDPDIGGKSTPGTIRIVAESAGWNRPPDTRPLPRRVVSADECGIRIILLPLAAPAGQAAYGAVLKRLGLKGEIWAKADDPLLDAALTRLIDDPFKPLRDLDTVGVPWGKPVEGVQVRVVCVYRVWGRKNYPSFEAEVRNQGRRDLTLCQAGTTVELLVDQTWYQWRRHSAPADAWSPFPPGQHFKDIDLGVNWRDDEHGGERVKRDLGKHTVRFAFIARPKEPDGGEPVRVVSNPVEVEVLP